MTLRLLVSSSHAAVKAERRFQKSDTLETIKSKLELVVGIPAASQKLYLKDAAGKTVCVLEGAPDTMLGAFPVEDLMSLLVENTDPTSAVGEYDDVSKVEKYELTEEEYESKRGTVLDFKRNMKLGRFNPEYEAEKAARLAEEEQLADAMKVGDRCEVTTTGGIHRGTVKYVGNTKFQEGKWIGVQLDEPYGKHNGTVKGHSYFSCPDKFGLFLKPKNVRVGDFPEEDLDLSSDDEM